MEDGIGNIDRSITIENERLTGKIVQMNYILIGCLVFIACLFGYQAYLAKENVTVEAATIVRLNLEGSGVVKQSHDLALRQENTQQTVVLTETNAKNGAPISISISTDTTNKEVDHVVSKTR